ncbi:IS66 family transposase [Mesorhizobium hawassense]|uniref:IS66 family transposase n=1 Tax=Mesorhizobium hawassense TaxID=1209954 RepID=UPI001ABFD6D8|nr:transposase [Mesorhizobium hawassense]
MAERIGDYARAGPAIHADDTPIPVQDPGRGRTKSGRLWVVVRDEGTWGSPNPPAAFYRYLPDRKGEHAQALLAPASGFLHADAYAGLDKLYEPDRITGRPRLEPVACWAHARRELFDEHAKTTSPIARQALDKIGTIFAVDREINGRSAAVRLAARQAQSVPLLADLKNYVEASLGRISRKADLAKAIRYSLNRWKVSAASRWPPEPKSEKRTEIIDGRVRKSYGHGKPASQWAVVLKDHHERYIGWSEYERNEQLLAAGYPVYRCDRGNQMMAKAPCMSFNCFRTDAR